MSLTIETTAALDAWLAAESALSGLDAPTFARMVLFQRMNGAEPKSSAPAAARSALTLRSDNEDEDAPVYGPREPASGPDAGNHVWMEEPEESIETIIERRVAERLRNRSSFSFEEITPEIRVLRRGLGPVYGGVTEGGIPFRHQRYGPMG